MTAQQFSIPGSRLIQQHAGIRDELDEALERVIARGVFTASDEVAAFEEEFARYVGVRHAVGVTSGSMAVLLAIRALGVESGDEVISVPNVDISASAPVTNAGARLVWVDIDPRTYNLDPNRLETALTARSRAIVVAHMYGTPADMAAILKVADRHGIPVIEDAALAHGARYRGQRVGSIGTLGCFSFSPGKTLGAFGKAGVVVTDDAELAARVRTLCTYGFTPASIDAVERGLLGARFEYDMEGFNARMDEVQAAVLRVKLRHLDGWVQRRRRHVRRYREMLSDLTPEYLLLPAEPPDALPSPRVFVIRTSRRDDLMHYLAERGIWSGLQYVPPLHVQPVYRYLGYERGDFPNTEVIARELLALPTIPELSDQEITDVGRAVRRFYAWS